MYTCIIYTHAHIYNNKNKNNNNNNNNNNNKYIYIYIYKFPTDLLATTCSYPNQHLCFVIHRINCPGHCLSTLCESEAIGIEAKCGSAPVLRTVGSRHAQRKVIPSRGGSCELQRDGRTKTVAGTVSKKAEIHQSPRTPSTGPLSFRQIY